MINIISIFIGGGLGATLRYICSILLADCFKTNFPVTTLFVNIIGCFILGFLYFLFIDKTGLPTPVKLVLTTGFCGGLTTFSTFSLETVQLFNNNQLFHAFLYIIASLILGIICVYLGSASAKAIV